MSSASSSKGVEGPVDDRTAKARIRDAAIGSFAENGIAGTTVRGIATAAGVSPGLVIHHFGSMDELRVACDEHIATTIGRFKHDAMSGGPNLDVLAALRNAPNGPLMGYLARVLTDDSPTVAALVDDLVADAESYIQQGVDSGILQPATDPRGRAVVLTLWNLGALVLHRHLHRLLGVDLTDPDLLADPRAAAYIAPVYEIYSEGVVTSALASQLRDIYTGTTETEQNEDTQEPGGMEVSPLAESEGRS